MSNQKSKINPVTDRVIEFYRHAHKANGSHKDMLSEKGRNEAKRLGFMLKDRQYKMIFLTTFFRTAQTAAYVVEGGKLAIGQFRQIDLIGTTMERCGIAIERAGGKQDMSAFKAGDPEFVSEVGATLAENIGQAFSTDLKDGEMALAFGHSPLLEIGIEALTGHTIQSPLNELDGARVTLHSDGTYTVEEVRYIEDSHTPSLLG